MSATQRIAAGLLLFASVVAIALARDFYQARTARARRAGRSLRKPVEPRRCTDSALTRRNSEEDLRQGAAAGLLMLSTGVFLHCAPVDTSSASASVPAAAATELTHSQQHAEPQAAEPVREHQESDAPSTDVPNEVADSEPAALRQPDDITVLAAATAPAPAPAAATKEWCGEILSPPTSAAAASRRSLRGVSADVARIGESLLGTEPSGLTAAAAAAVAQRRRSSSNSRRSSLAGLLTSMKTKLVKRPSVQRRASWWRRSSATTLAETVPSADATASFAPAATASIAVADNSTTAVPELGSSMTDVATSDAPPSAREIVSAPAPTTAAAAAAAASASAAAAASPRRRTAVAVPAAIVGGVGHTARTVPSPMISPQQAAAYTPPRQRDPWFDARDTLSELEQDYLAHIGVACTRRECDEWSALLRLRESSMRAVFAQRPAVSDPKLRELQAKTYSNLIRADIAARKVQLR
jgi:hypothetical protein